MADTMQRPTQPSSSTVDPYLKPVVNSGCEIWAIAQSFHNQIFSTRALQDRLIPQLALQSGGNMLVYFEQEQTIPTLVSQLEAERDTVVNLRETIARLGEPVPFPKPRTAPVLTAEVLPPRRMPPFKLTIEDLE